MRDGSVVEQVLHHQEVGTQSRVRAAVPVYDLVDADDLGQERGLAGCVAFLDVEEVVVGPFEKELYLGFGHFFQHEPIV